MLGGDIEKVTIRHICTQCANPDYIDIPVRNIRKTEHFNYQMRIMGRVAEFMALVIELARKFFNSKKNNKKLKIILVDK